MINIVAKRMWFLTASTIILIVGILSLTFPPHLNLGIDFLSGTGITVKFVDEVIISNDFTPINILKKLKPDLYFKGSDYSVFEDDVSLSILLQYL